MPTRDDDKILQFFDDHPNEPFEFVTVTDINLVEHPNNYKAIFRNIETSKHHPVEMPSEMMRYKYKPGYIYTDKKRVGQNENLYKDVFTVNTNNKIELKRISSIVSEDEVKNIIDYKDINKYFLRQFAHIEEQDDCNLIIPCYTIANKFYFMSSSMKHAIMSGSLNDLYYKDYERIGDNGERIAQIHIKKKANKKDLPFLYRFVHEPFSRKRVEYMSSLKTCVSKGKLYHILHKL